MTATPTPNTEQNAMARAISPSCPLAATSNQIPKPLFKVGDRVAFSFKHEANKAFYFRALLRHEIRQIRLHRKERPMLDYNKGQIRQKLRIICESADIEVAGIAPIYGQNVGHIANECYLPGVPGAASPLEFGFYLCFRTQDESGNTVAYVPKLGIVSGGDLTAAVPLLS